MNLLYLKYAATVADCGSISKAAERLYIGLLDVRNYSFCTLI